MSSLVCPPSNLLCMTLTGLMAPVDQMVCKYSTKRATRRWPLPISYTLVDIAALNGHTTFLLNWNKKKLNQQRLISTRTGTTAHNSIY